MALEMRTEVSREGVVVDVEDEEPAAAAAELVVDGRAHVADTRTTKLAITERRMLSRAEKGEK